MDISVFGLGKVGLTLAACLSAAGHRVIGYDVNEAVVESVNDRRFDNAEAGVAERVVSGALRATHDVREAVTGSALSFVIVPTPSNVLHGFSNQFASAAMESIGKALAGKHGRHTVALVSTVLPGSCEAHLIPILERASGRKIGPELGFCYNPAFIALGEVVRGFELPDYLLIGEADPRSGDDVVAALTPMVRNGAPAARMHIVEAEIAKVASNTHETMRVAFANMLFSLCAEVPGANVDRVTEALTHRMGRRFFRGATPYGGPCWPRDNLALSEFMDSIGVPSRLPRTVHMSNEDHKQHLIRKVLGIARNDQSVAVIGLAYKTGTAVVEHAFGVQLSEALAKQGRSVVVWDPEALGNSRAVLGNRVRYGESLADAVGNAEIVVITNPLPDLGNFDWTLASNATVVDCWRCLPPEAQKAVGGYLPMGVGPEGDVADWAHSRLGQSHRLLTE